MTAALSKRPKRAFITGVTGQDGSYLAELLLGKGYEVHGIKRRSSSFNTERVDHLLADWHEHDAKFFMHFADLADTSSLSKLLYRIAPDEIYHLGAQSHVRVSFDIPEYTGDITALGNCAPPRRHSRNRNPRALLQRRQLAKCTANPTSVRKTNPLRSILAAPTAAPSYTATG